MSRTDAVEALYQDMAARHRARFRSIHVRYSHHSSFTNLFPSLTYPSHQILKVVEIEKTSDVKRPYLKQLLTKNLKFPLPHRVAKSTSKKLFSPNRPSTFAQREGVCVCDVVMERKRCVLREFIFRGMVDLRAQMPSPSIRVFSSVGYRPEGGALD